MGARAMRNGATAFRYNNLEDKVWLTMNEARPKGVREVPEALKDDYTRYERLSAGCVEQLHAFTHPPSTEHPLLRFRHSMSCNRAREESNVDILIVVKEHERTQAGEPVDLQLAEVCGREMMCIWQGPDWAWGHIRVEALLSSRTVYGNRTDVERLHDAMTFLDDGFKRFPLIAEAVEKIKNQVATVQTYENFINPSQQLAREATPSSHPHHAHPTCLQTC
ncbi:putative nucleotidyltransferase domain containing protein [Lyophyllum shimeji]|uniref:Nucleotidyltransferase domain containing protein n=1 Tax=Lyophyllum shimeji TaxID=47721 RepID=A0A9P3UMX3_LYOSH|nr:putative nucleotidyltransferase domain containing protein [Lyophyllum shimeji]